MRKKQPRYPAAAPGETGFAGQTAAAVGMNTVGDMADTGPLVRDMDMAEKLLGLIKADILEDTGTLMLAQAHVSSVGVILLLQWSRNQ